MSGSTLASCPCCSGTCSFGCSPGSVSSSSSAVATPVTAITHTSSPFTFLSCPWVPLAMGRGWSSPCGVFLPNCLTLWPPGTCFHWSATSKAQRYSPLFPGQKMIWLFLLMGSSGGPSCDHSQPSSPLFPPPVVVGCRGALLVSPGGLAWFGPG